LVAKSKIKQVPEDFLVEEIPNYAVHTSGRFAFYRLEKTSWTTHDAIFRIRRTWQLDGKQVSYGGLKDKHAVTIQYISIDHGPNKNLDLPGVRLTFLGYGNTPYSSRDFEWNRFRIHLRNLDAVNTTSIAEITDQVPRCGVPNYFDDQRFGSLNRDEKDFVARRMVLADFEGALKTALTKTFPLDSKMEKDQKSLILKHWGQWESCKPLLEKGHARSLVDYLIHHPTDFHGALDRMRPDIMSLYLSAYQSYLWNEILANWIRKHTRTDQVYEFELKLGKYPAPIYLEDKGITDLQMDVPLPSYRLKLHPEDPIFASVNEVFEAEGYPLEKMKLPKIKKFFFSKGERPGFFKPVNMKSEILEDDLNRGKKMAAFTFDLPRGSYATLVIKSIQSLLKQ